MQNDRIHGGGRTFQSIFGGASRPRRDRGLWPLVEFLENRQLLSGSGPFQFEFGTSRSPLDPGFIRIAATPYNARHGYGWTGKGGITAKDLGRRVDPATRHFNAGRDKTFLLNLSNGIYDVSPTLGNAKASLKGLSLWINGTLVAAGLGSGRAITCNRLSGWRSTRASSACGSQAQVLAPASRSMPFRSSSHRPPSIDAGSPLVGAVGQSVNFQATASAPVPLGYHWAFGDGGTADGTLFPTHVYATPGSYVATLTASDGFGLSNSATVPIQVQDVAPALTPRGPPLRLGAEFSLLPRFGKFALSRRSVRGLPVSLDFGDGDHGDGGQSGPHLRPGRHLHRHSDGHR